MEFTTTSRRAEILGKTVRRLLRRGGRQRLSRTLAKVRPQDVAYMLRGMTPAEQLEVFKVLISDFPQVVTDILTDLEPQQRRVLLEQLQPVQIAKFLELAAVDDAVFLLDSLPDELKERVLEIVDIEERFAQVQQHLTYHDDTAGRIMDTEFMAVEEETNVAEAIARVRQFAHDVDMISYLYVVDKDGHLLGVVSLRQLLLAEPTENVGKVMNTALIKVHTSTDQEEVAQISARYDLLAIPVTDDDNRLVGIITVDDIIDVFKEEANEDFYKMAGTTEDELLYQEHSLRVAGIRLPWILVNLLGLLAAAAMTAHFEETFKIAFLVGFIPLIMGMAGNIGTQTSTIAVRGLATGRLSTGPGRVRQFLWQQLKVGVVLAVVCTSLVAAVMYFVAGKPSWIIPVALSLLVTVTLASCNGVLIPVVFKRLGVDPAIASGPLVTTLNDVLGILIYLGMTTVLFRVIGA